MSKASLTPPKEVILGIRKIVWPDSTAASAAFDAVTAKAVADFLIENGWGPESPFDDGSFIRKE